MNSNLPISESDLASEGSILSRRSQWLEASPIRQILSVINRPGMVSMAGGLPAQESFPDLSGFAVPNSVLQYGPSEGEPELREVIADDLRRLGLKITTDQVLVISGSQQGLDLAAKIVIDEGDAVAVESPTYLAALQVFRFFGAKMQPYLPCDDLPFAASPKLIYAIPNFQNPSSATWTAKERELAAWKADRVNGIVLEDDPYRELNYEQLECPLIVSMVKRASWIYQGSFSKSLCPGLRVGFLAASKDLMPYLIRAKQATDLHSNRLGQWIVLESLRDANRALRLDHLRRFYRERRDSFQDSLNRHFQGLAQWEQPSGGLFFWLKLNKEIDTRVVLEAALAQNVAFMPGEYFFPLHPAPQGYLRLNFSHPTPAQADEALRKLAAIIESLRPA